MKKLSLLFLGLAYAIVGYCQTSVSIKITDANTQSPLPGVTIIVKGTTSGASTDADGRATVLAKGTDSLIIQYISYTTKVLAINNQTNLFIPLSPSAVDLGDVVVVGTRTAGRIKTESPAPVDVINVTALSIPTGRNDVTSLLNYMAPSLNSNKQSGSDGADHIDLATLRGLGPDQTLVLVNGKRRHQTAFVAVFGTRGRGNSGTDLNAIPISSIDRVEILRDGASAQYGSDAIAGVINIILKKNIHEFTGDVSFGGYSDKNFNPAFKPELQQYEEGKKFDGKSVAFNGNYGVPLGKKNGFINFSISALNQDKTLRQALDTSNLFTNKESLPINIYRRGNGDGSTMSIGGFYNLETGIGHGTSRFYSFGGYTYSKSDAFAYSRNYSARPERFPTDASGNLIFVDGIMHKTADGETYYNPHIQTNVADYSVAVGANGTMAKGWKWDLSNTLGKNDFHFYGDKTFNASLGTAQTHFDDGGFSFLQNTTNLDFTKEIKNVAEGMQLSAGAEYRIEQYNLYAGEVASYKNYDTSGAKATGAQGFPGYQPSDEVTANRSTIGAYIDAELDITKSWLLTGAVRAENYSDFGFTSNYKMSTRYKVAKNFNLRGSISTGFRAPSLQQINFSSTFTNVQGGLVAEVKIAPNYSPITKAAGIPDLKQEQSVNFGVGFTWSPAKNFNITVDGYMVKVKDRVVLSGQFDASDATLDPAFLAALNNLHASFAQFFANAVNTTNNGLDIVLEYKKITEKHTFRATLSGNLQKMTIDKVNVPTKLNDTEQHRKTFLSDREESFILASAPKSKFSLNLEYGVKKFTFGTRLTYFGEVTVLGYGEDALGINPQVPTDANPAVYVADKYIYSGKVVTDLFVTYKLCKSAKLVLGVDNLFGVHPDLGAVASAKYWAFNNESAGPWDAVQMGGNGMKAFAKLALNF